MAKTKTKTAAKRKKSVSAKIKLSQKELNELIQKKAFELHEIKGRAHGCDLDDWLEAEKVIKTGKY